MSALSDPISDFLTRLRNSSRAGKVVVRLPHSRIKHDIANVLMQEGFVAEVGEEGTGIHKELIVTLKFVGKIPALTDLQRSSRPGLRRYVDADSIPRVRGGNGIAILSTSRGVMSGREARRQNVGGELLAFIY